MGVDRSKLLIETKEKFAFNPHRPTDEESIPLADAKLRPKMELLIFERGGLVRCVDLPSVSYHHAVQGELAGEPYLVTF